MRAIRGVANLQSSHRALQTTSVTSVAADPKECHPFQNQSYPPVVSAWSLATVETALTEVEMVRAVSTGLESYPYVVSL